MLVSWQLGPNVTSGDFEGIFKICGRETCSLVTNDGNLGEEEDAWGMFGAYLEGICSFFFEGRCNLAKNISMRRRRRRLPPHLLPQTQHTSHNESRQLLAGRSCSCCEILTLFWRRAKSRSERSAKIKASFRQAARLTELTLMRTIVEH